MIVLAWAISISIFSPIIKRNKKGIRTERGVREELDRNKIGIRKEEKGDDDELRNYKLLRRNKMRYAIISENKQGSEETYRCIDALINMTTLTKLIAVVTCIATHHSRLLC